MRAYKWRFYCSCVIIRRCCLWAPHTKWFANESHKFNYVSTWNRMPSNSHTHTFAERIYSHSIYSLAICLFTATSRNSEWKEYFGFDKQFIFMSYTRSHSMNIENVLCVRAPYMECFSSNSVLGSFVLVCFVSFHFSPAKGDLSFLDAMKGNFVRCQ